MEKLGGLLGQRPQGHQVLQTARLDDELADIYRPVASRDVRDHHVESRSVRQRRIYKRGRRVQAPTGALQHPLNNVPDLLVREGDAGELGFPVARDVDLIRGVEPDFLDGWIIQKRLQRSESGNGVEDKSPGPLQRAQRRHRRQQRTLVIVTDYGLHQLPHFGGLPERVEAAAADQFPHLVLDDANSLHAAPSKSAAHAPGRRNFVQAMRGGRGRQGRPQPYVGNPKVAT